MLIRCGEPHNAVPSTSIIGQCNDPIDAGMKFAKLEITFSAFGSESGTFTGTVPHVPFTNDWHMDPASAGSGIGTLDGDTFSITWDSRRKYYRPASLDNLTASQFAVTQDTCCCPCRWEISFKDEDSGYNAGSPTDILRDFGRFQSSGLTQSYPRMIFTKSGTVDSFPNLDARITNPALTGARALPCRRHPVAGGDWTPDPDKWVIIFQFNTPMTASVRDGGDTTREITVNGGSTDTIIWADSFSFTWGQLFKAIEMTPCLDDQEYSVTVHDHSEIDVINPGGLFEISDYSADAFLTMSYKLSSIV